MLLSAEVDGKGKGATPGFAIYNPGFNLLGRAWVDEVKSRRVGGREGVV